VINGSANFAGPGIHAESLWSGAVGANLALARGGALPRWVVSESGGDLVCKMAGGQTGTIKLPKMVPVPLQIETITAVGSTAHTLLFVW